MEMSKELKDMAEALAKEAKVTLPIDIFDKKHRNRLSRSYLNHKVSKTSLNQGRYAEV